MRTELTSLERLEAQIRALPDGTPQGAAWEAALVGWVSRGGHPDLGKVAFRAGRAGGERGIRTLDGITPKPSVPIGPRRGIGGILRES